MVSRVLGLMAQGDTVLAARWERETVAVSDVAPAHLAYPAVRRAVAAGVLPLEGGAFRLLAPVGGAEIIDAVARLAALAGGRP